MLFNYPIKNMLHTFKKFNTLELIFLLSFLKYKNRKE